MGRRILVQDDFNRADSADLGADWDAGYTGDVACEIVGNRVRSTSITVDSNETWNKLIIANDQWAEITLATWAGAGSKAPRVLLRFAAPPTKSGYDFVGRAGTPSCRIRRWDNGVSTTLAENDGATWGAGDILRGEIRGTKFALYRNNGSTPVLTAFDNAATYPKGRPGVIIFNSVAGESEIDNFSAGDFWMPRLGSRLRPAPFAPGLGR